MNPKERMNDLRVAVSAAIDGRLTQVWTAMPAKIVSFNATLQTAQVEVQLIPLWNNPVTGKREELPFPIINDCVVMFPGGGGFHLTFPVKAGDECLMILASRCIDGWWGSGKPVPQTDLRMHDLSDGFLLVGVNSKAHALSGLSTSAVQLRSDDGLTFIEIAGGAVNVSTGASGTFTTASGQVVTVQNGIVTNII